MTQQTLMLIKPNVTKKNKSGEILAFVESKGFKIKRIKSLTMDNKIADEFYAVHKDKHFFKELVDFMTSGMTIAVVLERDNAIEYYREIIGATNYKEAKPGTIRAKYADGLTENAVHGSDSSENAKKEISIIFK